MVSYLSVQKCILKTSVLLFGVVYFFVCFFFFAGGGGGARGVCVFF